MSKRPPTPRATQAVAELRAAAENLKANEEPTPMNRAIVELLDAVAGYWAHWLPAEPTRIDRALLGLARSLHMPPAAAAGTLPATSNTNAEGAAS